MNIPELLQKLDVGALIEMFELDLTSIGGEDVLYFHAGTNELRAPIVWQSNTYQPWPVMAEGFEVSTRGTLPRPTIRIANVTGMISAAVMELDDLVGAKVTRRRTFAQFLDGQPGADPDQHLADDIYFIERKVSENKTLIQFELASAMDLEGVQLPFRVITINSCSWKYRGAGCGYAGSSYFDVHDEPVGSLALDVCSKKVSGCKARFGARGVLPYGGFPAARAYRV
jgi:lambda family phage minor tail protein L